MSTPAKYHSILDESAGFLMGVTYRKISQLFMHHLKTFDITPEQWLVLFCIQQEDGMIQKDIASKTHKDKATTTRILDVLEAKGFVTKKTGQTDRRSFLVYATDKGRELVAQTEALERQTVEEATAGISQSEYRLLIDLLQRIGENIDRITEKE